MLRKNNKYISNFGGQNEAAAQVVLLNFAVRYWILPFDIEYTKCERLQV